MRKFVVLASSAGLLVLLVVPGCRQWGMPQPVDPAVAALIDKLTAVSDEGPGTHSTAWASGFIAVDDEFEFNGGMLGSHKPLVDPSMRQLVRLGVRALPDLLNHLSDSRETRLTVRVGTVHPQSGLMWHSDEYDPRHSEPRLQPPGLRGGIQRYINGKEYTLRVGDLCYVAVGQIVNRTLSATRYQPSLCLVINSPVQMPSLAAAVRYDWEGLTREQHQQSLAEDALTGSYGVAPAALRRLYFYYPEEAEPLVLKLLTRPLTPTQQAKLVSGLSGLGGPKVDAAVAKVFRALVPGRHEADDLALACMERLLGKGLGNEFEAYCTKRIAEMKKKQPHLEASEERSLEQLQQMLGRIRAAGETRKKGSR